MPEPLTDADVQDAKNRVRELTYSLLLRHPLLDREQARHEAEVVAKEWFKSVKLVICEAEE